MGFPGEMDVLEEMEEGWKRALQNMNNIVFHSLGWGRQVTPKNSVKGGGAWEERCGSLGGRVETDCAGHG